MQKEWIRLDVTLKKTSHERAPDAAQAITRCLQEMGIADVTVEWFWGSMPGEKRPAAASTRRSDKNRAAG